MARIYVFEDDASLRSLLVEMLRDELGAEAEPCSSMTELQACCAKLRPDMIVADFWGTSHLELDEAERAEVNALAAVAPLVLISARNWALGAEASELGVAALLPKPLDIERFASMVRDMLASRGEVGQGDSVPTRDARNVVALGWPQA